MKRARKRVKALPGEPEPVEFGCTAEPALEWPGMLITLSRSGVRYSGLVAGNRPMSATVSYGARMWGMSPYQCPGKHDRYEISVGTVVGYTKTGLLWVPDGRDQKMSRFLVDHGIVWKLNIDPATAMPPIPKPESAMA